MVEFRFWFRRAPRTSQRQRTLLALLLVLLTAAPLQAAPATSRMPHGATLPPTAAPAAITAATTWLRSQQASNGSWGPVSTRDRDTYAVLQAWQQLGLSDGASRAAGNWAAQRLPTSVDDLATKILSLKIVARSTTGLDTQLLALRNANSQGFGYGAGYDTDLLSTLLALRALEQTGHVITNAPDQSLIIGIVIDLIKRQNSGAGWGYVAGDTSRVSVTALVMDALWPYRGYTLSDGVTNYVPQTAINTAVTWIKAQQQAGGNWTGDSAGTVINSALAITALYAVQQTPTNLTTATSYLTTSQQANGSWQNTPFATALAVRALHRLP